MKKQYYIVTREQISGGTFFFFGVPQMIYFGEHNGKWALDVAAERNPVSTVISDLNGGKDLIKV